MMAVFYLYVLTPFSNDSLISLVMGVINDGYICFNIVGGITSSSEHQNAYLLLSSLLDYLLFLRTLKVWVLPSMLIYTGMNF